MKMSALPEETERTRRYNSKREQILVAATDLLNLNGVRGFTLADVSQRVGLNTPSVAYYFRKKEDLAAACLLSSMERFTALVEQSAKGRNARERISLLIDGYFALRRRIRQGEEPAMASFNEVRAFKPPHDQIVFDGYINMFRAVRRLLDEPGMADDHRRRRTARARIVIEMLLWAPSILAHYEADEFDRARRRFADVVLDGIAGAGQRWKPHLVEPPPPRADEPGDAAREAFLIAATQLLNEQGYRGASVDKISARLNVTKGSFYHYNDNKDDLVSDCFRRSLFVIRSIERAAAREETGWDRLCSASAALLRFQISNRGPILRLSAIGGLPARGELINQFDRVSDRFAAVISEGIADGSIRPIDPIIASQMFAAMINSSAGLPAWLPDVTMDEVPALYAKPLLMGLFAD
jgi:AcrR family transcriptional regulator